MNERGFGAENFVSRLRSSSSEVMAEEMLLRLYLQKNTHSCRDRGRVKPDKVCDCFTPPAEPRQVDRVDRKMANRAA